MEWGQYGAAEKIITRIYRWALRRDASYLEDEFVKLLKQRVVKPTKVLVVASHFGLAHQLSAIRKNLERRAGIKLILVMQVTDDSPQKIWYVPGIDLITVPSEQTRQALLSYGRSSRLERSPIEVLPYPISPHLGENLLPAAMKHRQNQLSVRMRIPINVSIPVSGAGVGTMYASTLMSTLHRENSRFLFHLVAKRAMYTDMFLRSLAQKDYIEVSSSHSDREIVELYEQLYDRVVVSLEITKPSEQAFKALLLPKQTGGVILLFSQPVGRQEFDNLNFLRGHGLIPTAEEQTELFDFAAARRHLQSDDLEWILARAKQWRGVCLPHEARSAAHFINWCHSNGVFLAMLEIRSFPKSIGDHPKELGGDGVKLFWNEVEKLL